ncbi:hypothetical protein F6Q06_08465 [Pectobacterium parmentieri]|uniref:Uncharacterized protein n=1 Tax=Pectobacterium parmentieri TaxID=1905730 RepID=A0ABS0RZW0_PECPM|nr:MULTISPECIES: hypothetical protein [Pectobacterium]MBI0554522.1 hypothetical protein [Pectobacterium parmentieri]
MITTDVIYARPFMTDDGCDHTDRILWAMNANARARTRSPYVPAPAPRQVVAPKFSPLPKTSGKKRLTTKKTHTGTVLRVGGERTVKLRETPTTWVVGTGEFYYKDTGTRAGGPTRARLLLDTIKPIEA